MSVYLLLGNDEERKARSIQKLRGNRQVQSYDAAESGPDAVVTACNSSTLFGGGAFVVLKNLDVWNAAQKAQIVKYLEDPAQDTDLILLGRKLPSRDRLFAAVQKAGEVHTLDQPTGKDLLKWTVSYAARQGVELPREVAVELIARCFGDKVRLLREVDKLALYKGDGNPVAVLQDVQLLCAPDLQTSIFSFVDSLTGPDTRSTLGFLEQLLEAGEPPLRIAFMARRQFNLLARTKALIEQGVSRQELPQRLKVPPFVARKLQEQARTLKDRDLEHALTLMLDLERGLKGGKDLSPELQMELAVLGYTQAVSS